MGDLEAALALGLFSVADRAAVEAFVDQASKSEAAAKAAQDRLEDKSNWVHVGGGFFSLSGTKQGAMLGFNVGGVPGPDRHPSLPSPEEARRGAVQAAGVGLMVGGVILIVYSGGAIAAGPLSLLEFAAAMSSESIGFGAIYGGTYLATGLEALKEKALSWIDIGSTLFPFK